MAMSREEQRESAGRIMGKLGPLSVEEQRTYDLLTRTPEEYIAPDPNTGERVCGICWEVFQTIQATREHPQIPALEQFSDHQTTHNPSPVQWWEAHRRIQEAKESRKGREE